MTLAKGSRGERRAAGAPRAHVTASTYAQSYAQRSVVCVSFVTKEWVGDEISGNTGSIEVPPRHAFPGRDGGI